MISSCLKLANQDLRVNNKNYNSIGKLINNGFSQDFIKMSSLLCKK